ncbi:hypothetical protein C1H46_026784 [Malus baccata]|uniref:Uncharacterized protein n=1 Tax=Malus baccata TaxID=106549 RepID=A0A540LME9_MALBA|nr:hypothetical protein C1H46_026784 [Malus baccata]
MPKQDRLTAIHKNAPLWPEQFKFKQPQLGFHNINNPCVDMYFHCAKDAMLTVEFHKTLMNHVFPSAGRTIL